MTLSKERWIEEKLNKAKDEAGDLQPWPNYFEAKAKELETILNFCRLGNTGSLLELGCGNGFTAMLLSEKSERVTAFDLPSKNPASHSLGIEIAEDLIKRLHIKNVDVISGSVEKLPFPDSSFDVIFSEYMLQYVNNKDIALVEMRRVLKDNGMIVTIVPNFMERVIAPLVRYEYIAKRILFHLINRMTGRNSEGATLSESEFRDRELAKKIAAANSWFLLRPDGAYKSFMEEMARHTPICWKRLFRKNGFKVTRTFSTEMLPLSLFDFLGPCARMFISRNSYRLNRLLGGKPILKNFGYSIGLVAVKDRS